jgi:hypothetical protein
MAWGDVLEPALEMAKKANVQYISFDFLAELTMSVLYMQRLKNPKRGYIPDVISHFREILPVAKKRGIKLTTNGGGANPGQLGEELVNLGKELGLTGLKIGVVLGDDLTTRLDELRGKGIKFTNLDTGEEDIERVKDKIAGAYAYIGADRIIEALGEGADVVIGGRFADNALYVGPWMYEFGWDYKEPYINKIAGAVTMGHIIECSCCSTGGMMCSLWKDVPEPWHIGYPIIEMDENGDAVVTKTPDTGGLVNTWTMKEHLTYEVHDPKNYLMPDGIADFTTLKLEQIGKDRVKITNMSGKPRPDMLKLGIGYDDGWTQELETWYCWPDALEKAKRCEFILKQWLKYQEIKPERVHVDYMGFNLTQGSVVPVPQSAPDIPEVGLRVCAKFKTREEALFFRSHRFCWSAAPAGWCFKTATAPAPPSRTIALWPTLVPREEVPTELIMKEVK